MAPVPASAEPATWRLTRAAVLEEARDFEGARGMLEAYLDEHPEAAPAWRRLRQIYVELARASLARSLDLVEVGSPAAVAVAPARAAVPAEARDLPAQPARAVPPATDAPLSAASSPPPTTRGTAAVPAQAELPAAPRPASPAADTRSNAQVEALTAAWARAWAARDVEAYLGFYATGFVGVGARDHTDWVAQRRRALDRARELRIIIEQLQVQPAADGQIEVRFRQLYRATGLSLDASKTLIWQIENGRWAIVSERVTTERRR